MAAWSDDPLGGVSGDAFERAEFADAATRRIVGSHSWRTSIVFALTGPWGTGKSSTIAMVRERIAAMDPHWQVVTFSPWASADPDAVVAEFYTSLVAALPAAKAKRARDALAACFAAASPGLRAIPVLGNTASGYADFFGERLRRVKPWNDAFDEAATSLRKLGLPILVVIDDLDRLQRDELLVLLRVVRLLGRFPGVQFLLAYDEQTLAATLAGGQGDAEALEEARRFIEKIVQYPLTVPPLSDTQILHRLQTGLTAVLDEAGRDPLPLREHRFARTVESAFRGGLRTPRAIDRYLAQLSHCFTMIDHSEVNDADLAMVVYLKVQLPGLYAALPLWKAELCRSDSRAQFTSQRTGQATDDLIDWEPLFGAAAPGGPRNQAWIVLPTLFPVIARSGTGAVPRPRRGISDPDYFDRYFTLSVPRHDVRDAEVVRAVESAALRADSRALEDLLTSGVHARVALVLAKAQAFTAANSGSVVSVNLVRVVAGTLELIEDEGRSLFSNRRRAVVWLAAMLRDCAEGWTVEDVVSSLLAAPHLASATDVLSLVLADSDREVTPASRAAARRFAELAAPIVQNHLLLGDDAPAREIHSLIRFIAEYGDGDEMVRWVQAAAHEQSLSAETLGSRLVSRQQRSGPSTRAELGELDQDLFNRFAPADDRLYDMGLEHDLDEYDLSWANRRRFVRGRARRPVR